jgi:hypothetical protein
MWGVGLGLIARGGVGLDWIGLDWLDLAGLVDLD